MQYKTNTSPWRNEYAILCTYNRAKKKALAILDKTMSSKEQIRTKLRRNDFCDEVIDKVISLLEEYNLLNDYEYAKVHNLPIIEVITGANLASKPVDNFCTFSVKLLTLLFN